MFIGVIYNRSLIIGKKLTNQLFSIPSKISASTNVTTKRSGRFLGLLTQCSDIRLHSTTPSSTANFCKGKMSALAIFEAQLSTFWLVGNVGDSFQIVAFYVDRAIRCPRDFCIYRICFPLDVNVAKRFTSFSVIIARGLNDSRRRNDAYGDGDQGESQ